MWDPYAEFDSATLPNGLTVHSAHWPDRPWETVGFMIHSGAEHDPVGLEGLAHFVEHLVGGNANNSRKEIFAFFEDCGGGVSLGSTSYPRTDYHFVAPTNKEILTNAFSIFGYMLLSAKLEKTIAEERQIIIREFHRNFRSKLDLDMATHERKVLYSGDFLERFVIPLGNPESIERITQSDLQSYYDTHYTPQNISIVGVGGMRLVELVELLSKSPFAISKKGIRTPLPIPTTDVPPPSETRYVFKISKHSTVSFEVGSYRSVTKIPGNVNGVVIRMLRRMLDEVLMDEVREKRGWAYDISASQCNLRYFYEFSIECNALAIEAINEIEEVIETCINSLGDREDLFEQVKRRALASNFMIDITGGDICSGALNDLSKYERIISLSEVIEDIERMTMNDVRSSLKWLRPERRWTIISEP